MRLNDKPEDAFLSLPDSQRQASYEILRKKVGPTYRISLRELWHTHKFLQGA